MLWIGRFKTVSPVCPCINQCILVTEAALHEAQPGAALDAVIHVAIISASLSEHSKHLGTCMFCVSDMR